MSYFWATWLQEALQADPFVKDRLVVVQGWETRGRPGAFLPSGVLEHHTACMARDGHDPARCLDGILTGNSVAPGPISQLLGTWTPLGTKWGGVADPRIVLVAAGRSNHAGAGQYPWGAPGGNGSSIGIEWCGPSQSVAWPDVVIELRERVTAALLKNRGWSVEQVATHWEYARPVGRKIDPSGPWIDEQRLAWNKPWDPAAWRARLRSRLEAAPTQQFYTVVAGDSWWGIAVKVYGNGTKWPELAAANGGTQRVLHPGDLLVVPTLSDGGVAPNPPGGGGGDPPPHPNPQPPTPNPKTHGTSPSPINQLDRDHREHTPDSRTRNGRPRREARAGPPGRQRLQHRQHRRQVHHPGRPHRTSGAGLPGQQEGPGRRRRQGRPLHVGRAAGSLMRDACRVLSR